MQSRLSAARASGTFVDPKLEQQQLWKLQSADFTPEPISGMTFFQRPGTAQALDVQRPGTARVRDL